jgi:hypothetical protein
MVKTILILFGAFSFIYFFVERICEYINTHTLIETLRKIIMLPFGGICGVLVYLMYFFLNKDLPFMVLMLFGCIIITGLELLGGYFLNIKLRKILKKPIWDYSNYKLKLFDKEIPINFLGQINVLHSLGWFGISLPLFLLGDFLCR